MKLTITIGKSIIQRGGTVILFPKAVAAKNGCPEHIGVEVIDDFSFVEFDYCDTWTLRFEPAADADRTTTRFKPLTHGSGEYDDEQGKRIKVEEYQVFHVTGSAISERDSDARGVFFYEYLAKGVKCRNFGAHAKVCVPKDKSVRQ